MSDFLNRMKSAAKADLKTIVLPEGEDPRTIVAANKIIEEGLAGKNRRLAIVEKPPDGPADASRSETGHQEPGR